MHQIDLLDLVSFVSYSFAIPEAIHTYIHKLSLSNTHRNALLILFNLSLLGAAVNNVIGNKASLLWIINATWFSRLKIAAQNQSILNQLEFFFFKTSFFPVSSCLGNAAKLPTYCVYMWIHFFDFRISALNTKL